MDRPYSIDDLAQRWDVTPADVAVELSSGRLPSFTVNGKTRVTAAAVARFEGGEAALAPPVAPLAFEPAEPFRHTWPNGLEEAYDTAFSGQVRRGDDTVELRIGLGMRPTVGRERRRAVVFLVDRRAAELGRASVGRPLVEFVGTDDYDRTHLVASLIKTPGGKEVRSSADLPPEYAEIKAVPYDRVVTGPYSHRGLAVLLRDDDLAGMARHALIRGRFIGLLR